MSLTRNIEVKPQVGLATLPVAPGATFLKGDFLTNDGSGRLTQTVAAGSNYGSGATIIGQANENAVNDFGSTKYSASVIPVGPGNIFKLPLYHPTPSSAVFNTSLIGQSFELKNTSGGFPAVDISSTTNVKVRIVDVEMESFPGYPRTTGAGTIQYPFVWIEFLPAAQAFEEAN